MSPVFAPTAAEKRTPWMWIFIISIATLVGGIIAGLLSNGLTSLVSGQSECLHVCANSPCYTTIQDGVSDALQLDRSCVDIEPGNYEEHVEISDESDLIIKGEDPDDPPRIVGSIFVANSSDVTLRDLHVVYGSGGQYTDAAIGVDQVEGVSLERIEVGGSESSGIKIDYSQDVSIEDSESKNNNHHGVLLDSVDVARISNSVFENNGEGGIGITNASARCYNAQNQHGYWSGCYDSIRCLTFPTENIVIEKNVARFNISGIRSDGANGLIIIGNDASQNYRHGINLQHVDNVFVFQNETLANHCEGIGVYQSGDGQVLGNTSSGNTHNYVQWANSNVTWSDAIPAYTFTCGVVLCYATPLPSRTPLGGCGCTPTPGSYDSHPVTPSFKWPGTATPGYIAATALAAKATYARPPGQVPATVTPTPVP